MTEILNDYVKGFKNYFRDFNKSKLYKILGKLVLISILICFNIVAIPCFLFYKLGYYRAIKQLKDSIQKEKPNYLSGIHQKPSQELISISEIDITDKNIEL